MDCFYVLVCLWNMEQIWESVSFMTNYRWLKSAEYWIIPISPHNIFILCCCLCCSLLLPFCWLEIYIFSQYSLIKRVSEWICTHHNIPLKTQKFGIFFVPFYIHVWIKLWHQLSRPFFCHPVIYSEGSSRKYWITSVELEYWAQFEKLK